MKSKIFRHGRQTAAFCYQQRTARPRQLRPFAMLVAHLEPDSVSEGILRSDFCTTVYTRAILARVVARVRMQINKLRSVGTCYNEKRS